MVRQERRPSRLVPTISFLFCHSHEAEGYFINQAQTRQEKPVPDVARTGPHPVVTDAEDDILSLEKEQGHRENQSHRCQTKGR